MRFNRERDRAARILIISRRRDFNLPCYSRARPTPDENARECTMPIMTDVSLSKLDRRRGAVGRGGGRGEGEARAGRSIFIRRHPRGGVVSNSSPRPSCAQSLSPSLIHSRARARALTPRLVSRRDARRQYPRDSSSFRKLRFSNEQRSFPTLPVRTSTQPPIPGVFLHGLPTIISHCPTKSPGDRITSS